MREILFRGKRADNGEWVEGFPFVRRNTNGEVIDCFIIQEAYEQVTNGQRYVRSNLKSECFRVIPKTIRQFTGLTDKNGNKVFEGDIIKAAMKPHLISYAIGKVIFEYGTFKLKVYISKNTREYKEYTDEYMKSYSIEHNFIDRGYSLEVIGNIHDNPEFLKGGANE